MERCDRPSVRLPRDTTRIRNIDFGILDVRWWRGAMERTDLNHNGLYREEELGCFPTAVAVPVCQQEGSVASFHDPAPRPRWDKDAYGMLVGRQAHQGFPEGDD